MSFVSFMSFLFPIFCVRAMFELSVASKYLLPRRRQLSVSIISLVSILVISLVVWLIVVFFSVTEGLEKSWINKLTALTAPARITPTDAYYKSYYYQADTISADSGYTHKSIGEKLSARVTDPYDPEIDEEPPSSWPQPDRDRDGNTKDLVKLAFQSVQEVKGIPGLMAHDYEMSLSNIRLRLLRGASAEVQSFLSYPAYLSSFEPSNSNLKQTILPISLADINNAFSLLDLSTENILEDTPKEDHFFAKEIFHDRLKAFLNLVTISKLKTPQEGWKIPPSLLPQQASWTAYAVLYENKIVRILIPLEASEGIPFSQSRGYTLQKGVLSIQDNKMTFTSSNQGEKEVSPKTSLQLQGGVVFSAMLIDSSLAQANNLHTLQFQVDIPIQGNHIQGAVPYFPLTIGEASFSKALPTQTTASATWVYETRDSKGKEAFLLPKDPLVGEGVLVPKSFKETGTLIGDRGYLSYQATTASSVQEQRIPIYVAGFYDPGIIPLGGKIILANQEITSLIRATQHSAPHPLSNGINIRLDNLKQAGELKEKLSAAFKEKGIEPYWNIETYREYDFTKDLIQQLQSERNLFTLLATIIIIVACSNIISMLIILVNDKKVEIGILRSMGATSKSIAAIFGLCGCLMGLAGSAIGIGAALLTLKNLQSIIDFISRAQGYELFSRTLYGETMPHELSLDTLGFVLIATILVSLLAGIVPAVKASLLRPSAILRSE